jgi:hypothetical protein
VLRAYFDDAGRATDDPDVICWGGYVASPHDWGVLDGRWTALLRNPLEDSSRPPLEKGFHLSHCFSALGEFADYKPAERDRVRFNFRKLLEPYELPNGFSACLHPIGHAIYRPDWDQLVTGVVRDVLGDGSTACIRSCLQRALRFIKESEMRHLAVVVDQGAYTPAMDMALRQILSSVPDFVDVTITSAKVASFSGLQAADTLATELPWSAVKLRKNGGMSDDPHRTDLISKQINLTYGGVFVMRRAEIISTVKKVQTILDRGESPTFAAWI